MSIVLNPKEQQLCQLLIETTAYVKKTYPDLKPVQCRIAGGWVRDKLLGLDCDDVDVALDTMMGFDFAKYVNEYLSTTKSAISDENTVRHENHHGRHIAKISSNPSKSKHLETATAKFFGMHIDFVNLRSETYNADSRIPTDVEFGTPEQDALRRDCTINALFYNIHTNAIEDYTNHGLSDLSNHVIRTPLPAFQTFDDDPLRILRVVRFASRFGFRLVDEICNSVGDPKIQVRHHVSSCHTIHRSSIRFFKGALISKISKERIGTELNKMLKGLTT
ncbi:hypothetical protein BKA69DRAFT_1025447 [Paraphysoderma sedebokerense]|nr:hypothetical protein BKA69DRAFT_1025447 [Paraphysoderma sedebokerense]